MKTLKHCNHKLDLSNYGIHEEFIVFRLPFGYDFHNNLEFEKFEDYEDAVYIFTIRSIMDSKNSKKYKDEKQSNWHHKFIYCGKTSDIQKRFNDHHAAKDIMKEKANCICLCVCENKRDSDKLEKLLLGKFKFPVNKKDNSGEIVDFIKEAILAMH